MDFNKTQKLGGACAILEALIYISAFVVYGGILVFPSTNASAAERLSFLSDNYLILSTLNLVSYVLFGIILAGLAIAVHQRLQRFAPVFSKFAFVFGIIWVGLVIASGMIANIGLSSVIEMGAKDPDNAMLVWKSVGIVTEGLGGGNEVVGGIWVLLLSIISLQGQAFSKALSFLGLIVGIAGILTIYPLDIFTEIFGLSQIVWFIWIGIELIRKPAAE